MNFAILGIGNIGDEYINTRHNTGFILLDQFAHKYNCTFTLKKYSYISIWKYHQHNFYLLKPTTFVNLSGLAIRYWMNHLNIPIENILIIVDDINLEVGDIRYRISGGSGGHNGLKNISLNLDSENYKRLRVGVGNVFKKEEQKKFVLEKFTNEDLQKIIGITDILEKIIKTFPEQNENIRNKNINNIISQFYNKNKPI